MTGYALISLGLVCLYTVCRGQQFTVGRGIGDVTGLAAEGGLYGYANPDQVARGIHTRQYSRAFIAASATKRIVLVVVETTMISQAVRTGVHEKLDEMYGDLYTYDNVLLSPTHSHSLPGGYHTYWMYQTPSGGFAQKTFRALVDGIVASIQRAHEDQQPGHIYINSGDLLHASINRSPASYNRNPQTERDRYEHNVDKEMTILRFADNKGGDLGVVSLYPVHTTSLKKTNHLVSTDSKGYSALQFERLKNPGKHPGKDMAFLAGFAQTAEADTTPNLRNARCEGTDELCDQVTSTCPEDVSDELFDSAREPLAAFVDFRHQWINMSEVAVKNHNGSQVQLCRPAMGYSFAAGATDGPGFHPFTQGLLEGIEGIEDIIDTVLPRSEEIKACHTPKPVLLASAEQDDDWYWQPEVVPLQILRIGRLVLVGGPAEFTTMSGRRVTEQVRQTLVAGGFPANTKAVILSMANSYSSYVTTEEEYQLQRYEGASTIFGPNTLRGYLAVYSALASAMASGKDVDAGPLPKDLRGYPDSALEGILTDQPLDNTTYGDVLTDAFPVYSPGNTASATFVAGNPRNNLTTDGTFLEVQFETNAGAWTVAYTDAYWQTRFTWLDSCEASVEPACDTEQSSNATISWEIPTDQRPGIYRLVHYGHALQPGGDVTSYTGTSRPFRVSDNVKDVHTMF